MSRTTVLNLISKFQQIIARKRSVRCSKVVLSGNVGPLGEYSDLCISVHSSWTSQKGLYVAFLINIFYFTLTKSTQHTNCDVPITKQITEWNTNIGFSIWRNRIWSFNKSVFVLYYHISWMSLLWLIIYLIFEVISSLHSVPNFN